MEFFVLHFGTQNNRFCLILTFCKNVSIGNKCKMYLMYFLACSCEFRDMGSFKLNSNAPLQKHRLNAKMGYIRHLSAP